MPSLRARFARPLRLAVIGGGAHTMAFIEACIASHANGRWADVAALPVAGS